LWLVRNRRSARPRRCWCSSSRLFAVKMTRCCCCCCCCCCCVMVLLLRVVVIKINPKTKHTQRNCEINPLSLSVVLFPSSRAPPAHHQYRSSSESSS
jgi:hypothetical protein